MLSSVATYRYVTNATIGRLLLLRSWSSQTRTEIKKPPQLNEVNWNSAKPYKELPGPTIFQLFKLFSNGGDFHGLGNRELFEKIHERYGNLVRLPGMLGKRDRVYSFDPKHYEIIYRTEGQWPVRRGMEILEYYRKKVRPDMFKGIGGLGSDQGEQWGKMRSAVNPIMLQPKVVNTYVQPVDQVARDFVEKIKLLLDEHNQTPINFGNELNLWAFESIGVIALDERLGVLSFEKNPETEQIIQGVKDFFQLSYELEREISLWRYYATDKFKRVIAAFEVITKSVKKYVDNAVERLDKREMEGKIDPNNHSVLQKLLKINRDYAILMALDMLFAGIDTTSSASATLLYNLAKNQDKQDILRKEVFKVLPNLDSEMTSELLNNLPYLRACLKESMRIQPVVQGNLRATAVDLVLDGYQIPKDTDIVMDGITLQNDEKYYPESGKFMPERWLREEVAGCPAAKSLHPFVNLPFGLGPRMCIGRRFAELEIIILMLRIFREFRVEWNYEPIKYNASMVITPTSPLKFKFTKL